MFFTKAAFHNDSCVEAVVIFFLPLPSAIGKLISSLWPRSLTTSWAQWASEWALCVILASLRAVTWLCSGYLAY